MYRRFWLAAAVSFAGVALIALGKSGGVSASLKGDLLGIATAATWAAYTVAIAPLMRRYSPYRISALVLAVGWVAVAATGFTQVQHQSFHLSTLVWLCLLYATLGPLVVTNILWFKAVDRVGPSRATLFANLQPFIAAACRGAPALGEDHAHQVLGGAFDRGRDRALSQAARRGGRAGRGGVAARGVAARSTPSSPRPRVVRDLDRPRSSASRRFR